MQNTSTLQDSNFVLKNSYTTLKQMMEFLLLQLLNMGITYFVSSIGPYMDEEFHLDQQEHYLNNQWHYWNPKLTTPPGLYILNYPILKILSQFGIGTLIGSRLINTFIYSNINYILLRYKFQSDLALTFVLLPTIYFYNFLFYTDTLSITLLLLTYVSLNKGYYLISAIIGLLSVFSRQTNIIWVVYICIESFLSQNKSKVQYKDPRMNLQFYLQALIHIMLHNIGKIFSLFKYHITVTALFVIFVIYNRGVALGDKEHHEISFHASQLLYFFSVLFIYLPINIVIYFTHGKYCIQRMIQSRSALTTFIIVNITCFVIVHAFSYAHPFILSDNRHYTFYIWNRFLSKYVIRYSLIPVYSFIITFLFRYLIIRKDQIINLVLLILFIGLNLIPAKLIEFRYFNVCLLFSYFQIENLQNVKLNILFWTIINIIVFYVFLFREYKCVFGVCRFMF